jgi:uncharacterized protein YegP (UPF0339 family)
MVVVEKDLLTGWFKFNVKAANGKVLITSRKYSSITFCLLGIKALQENIDEVNLGESIKDRKEFL